MRENLGSSLGEEEPGAGGRVPVASGSFLRGSLLDTGPSRGAFSGELERADGTRPLGAGAAGMSHAGTRSLSLPPTALLSAQGVRVEHTAELRGLRFASSLWHETSAYSRALTPVLQALVGADPWGGARGPWSAWGPQHVPCGSPSQFVSSFRKTELEESCVGCTVLGYG